MNSYHRGPAFKYYDKDHVTTRADMVKLCLLLENHPYFKERSVTFEPEAITEGGIVYKSWLGEPLTIGKMYKSIRFTNYFKWPRITENVMNDWADDQTELEKYDSKLKMITFLKAFNGSDGFHFTKEELLAIIDCFNDVSLVHVKHDGNWRLMTKNLLKQKPKQELKVSLANVPNLEGLSEEV